jgi:hypothetical protein
MTMDKNRMVDKENIANFAKKMVKQKRNVLHLKKRKRNSKQPNKGSLKYKMKMIVNHQTKQLLQKNKT